jgi:hypothetical protein
MACWQLMKRLLPALHVRILFALLACALLHGHAHAVLSCSETDRNGNRSIGNIETTKTGAVSSFRWVMETPKGDRCEFDSKGFTQLSQSSGVEFRSDRGCRLFIWTQGAGTTLAANGCEAHCTGPQAHDYLWPIIFDKNGRGCGRLK